jgi:ribosome biogenesis protein MAK21
MLSHFHPSVSALTSHLLNHEPLSGKPDLTLHTLSHFLDRFIYRNAKAGGTPRGQSIMQPLAGTDSHDLLVSASGLAGDARAQVPVNSEEFWRKRTEDVAADDVFFHEYFNRVSKNQTGKKAQKKGKDPVARDEEEGNESDNESEIWQALVESRPGLEDDDEEDDLDMDDLESAYDNDEDEVDGSDDGGVIFNDESDEDEEDVDEEEDVDTGVKQKKTKASAKADEDEDDEDSFDMDVSDEEAFRDSDEDLPSDLDVDMGGVALPSTTADDEETPASQRKSKKRKLRNLPTFASMEDYAALLADEDDGMV